jgi:hypothetical protein
MRVLETRGGGGCRLGSGHGGVILRRVSSLGFGLYMGRFQPASIGDPWEAAGYSETRTRPDLIRGPNPQTHRVKTAPAPGLDGSKTRGFRVQTRPVAILNPGSATGYIGYI